ncbi:uncharacterized protein LOC119608667 [Lucilia sericata]|uniref:uncharacterized protein LOC119608667 n=1 Tax=Lucilia sericata TaxID=13632 RepID=UPI0018A8197E|nr:uncharacterized protein LOC119608667 [Lucilia sericata]
MWLNNLNELCIYRSRYVNILTRNTTENLSELYEVNETKFALNHTDCQIFLKKKSHDIEVLKVQGDMKDDNLQAEYFKFKVKPFRNLSKLIFYQMVVTNENLLVLSKNCLQLNSLHLLKCFCEHFETLAPGININIDSICKIKQLQELKFEPETKPGTIKPLKVQHVKYLLNNVVNLTSLSFKNFTIVCEEEDKTTRTYIPDIVWQLQVLNIGILNYDFWCTFTGYLKCCPQLRKLIIHVNDSNLLLNVKLIDILSRCCRYLETLCLEGCQLDIKDFLPLQGLQEISLISCSGLTFENLQQFLGGLKLKKFKLINSPVNKTYNYIYIAPSLESITIDTPQFTAISEIFQNSLNHFNALHTLNWLNGDITHNWIRDKCPQLKQLQLTNPYILPRIVLSMANLKELTFTTGHGLNWTLLKMLIRDMSLKRLNIAVNDVLIDNNRISQKCFRVATTLEFIKLPFGIFVMGLTHWLDVLDVNEQLGFLVYGTAGDILNFRLLCILLSADCLRNRSNRIKICGFKMELKDFEQKTIFREIVRLHINTNHYRTRKMPFTLEF